MRVEVWSDVVCPWCYLGKRRLEAALARFEHRDEVEVVWRSFELDPSAPPHREGTPAEHLIAKYGMSREQVEAAWERLTALAEADGLEYHLDRTHSGSSFDAHRVAHLAGTHGLAGEMTERLFRGYFTASVPIGDPEALARLAEDAGLPADEVADVLAGDRFADEVRADERRAQGFGITGVPFFAIDARYGVSGAQSADALLEALTRSWAEREPVAS